MEHELLEAGMPDVAQYAVSMAYRIRFVMQMNAREAMHLTELRSQPAGHPVYRRVAQAMHREIAAVHPAIGRDLHVHERRRGRSGTPGSRTPDRTEAQGPAAAVSGEAGSVSVVLRDRGAGRVSEPRRIGSAIIFYVGSIAKQFTAACVAAARTTTATLDLDAPPAEWVDDLPPWADRITIRQLVHHTAGVKERSRTGPGVPIDGVPAWGNAELVGSSAKVGDLDFEPGTRYALLEPRLPAAGRSGRAGVAAHRSLRSPVSGSSSRSGMQDTFFRDTETPLPARAAARTLPGDRWRDPRRAGAVPRGGRRRPLDHGPRPRALGRQLRRRRPHRRLAPRRLTTRGALDDGTPIHYAWGLSIRTHRGLPDREPRRQLPGVGSQDGALPHASARR